MFSRPSRRVSFAVAALLFLLTFVSYSLWPARELEPYFGPITRVNHVFQYFDEEWALSQELEKVEEQLQQKYPGLRLRFPDESYSGFPIILDVTYAVPVFEHFEDDDNGLPVPSVDAAAQAHPVPTLDTLPFASPSVDDKDLGAVSFLDVASVDHPVPQDDVFPIPPTDTLRASPAALHLLIAFACGILTSSVLAVVFLLFKRVLTSKRSSPITPFGSPVHTTDKPRRERVARSNSARAGAAHSSISPRSPAHRPHRPHAHCTSVSVDRQPSHCQSAQSAAENDKSAPEPAAILNSTPAQARGLKFAVRRGGAQALFRAIHEPRSPQGVIQSRGSVGAWFGDLRNLPLDPYLRDAFGTGTLARSLLYVRSEGNLSDVLCRHDAPGSCSSVKDHFPRALGAASLSLAACSILCTPPLHLQHDASRVVIASQKQLLDPVLQVVSLNLLPLISSRSTIDKTRSTLSSSTRRPHSSSNRTPRNPPPHCLPAIH